jgi:type II secretion system protein C
MRSGMGAWASIGVCALLSVALLADMMSIGTKLRSRQAATPTPALRSAPHSDGPAALARRVIASHLFGAPPSERESAPVTHQSLLLAGTIATADPRTGFGIIGHSIEATHLYAAGVMIPGGATLYEVYSDHVILEHAGQFETLRFRDDRRAQVARDVSRRSEAGPAHLPAESQAAVFRPQTVFERLGADPSWDADGHFRGYRVSPSPKVRRDLGLRPDDLVLAIDGVALKNLDDAQRVAQQGQAPAAITIERDGQELQISLVRAAAPQNLSE